MESIKEIISNKVISIISKSGQLLGTGITAKKSKIYHIQGKNLLQKSMLEPPEIALLYILEKEFYDRKSYIIDAGCLFGISTFALSAGVRNNSSGKFIDLPINSFDLFELSPPYDSFASGFHNFGPTSNALPHS